MLAAVEAPYRLPLPRSRAARARPDPQVAHRRRPERRRRRQRVARVPRRRRPRLRHRRRPLPRLPGVHRRSEVEGQGGAGLDHGARRHEPRARPGRCAAARTRRGEDRRPHQAGAARRCVRGADRRDLSRRRHRTGAGLHRAPDSGRCSPTSASHRSSAATTSPRSRSGCRARAGRCPPIASPARPVPTTRRSSTSTSASTARWWRRGRDGRRRTPSKKPPDWLSLRSSRRWAASNNGARVSGPGSRGSRRRWPRRPQTSSSAPVQEEQVQRDQRWTPSRIPRPGSRAPPSRSL